MRYAGTAQKAAQKSGRLIEGRLSVGVGGERGCDVAHGEIVERALDRLIEKRHNGRVAAEGERLFDYSRGVNA